MADQRLEDLVNGGQVNLTAGISRQSIAPRSGDVWGAAFEDSNIVGSALYSRTLRESIFPTDRTPISDNEINGEIERRNLSKYVGRFLDVKTRGQFDAVAHDIERELENETILANAGWEGFGAGLVAGVLDLPTLVPFGAAVRLGNRGVQAARVSFAGSAARLAPVAALDAGVTEVLLHATQQTRTLDESLANVGGSVLLTSALGAAIAKGVDFYTHRGQKFKQTLKQLETDAPQERADAVVEAVGVEAGTIQVRRTQGSTGTKGLKSFLETHAPEGHSNPANANPHGARLAGEEGYGFSTKRVEGETRSRPGLDRDELLSPSQLVLANSMGIANASQSVQKRVFGRNLALDLLNSPSVAARQTMSQLETIGLDYKGTIENNIAAPTPVTALLSRLDGENGQAQRGLLGAYRKWRQGPDLMGGQLRDFNRLVSEALADGTRHADEQVTKAAQSIRKFFKEIAEENIRAGLMRRRAESPADGFNPVEGRTPVEGPESASPRGSGGPDSGNGGSQARIEGEGPAGGRNDPNNPRKDSPELLTAPEFFQQARKGKLDSTTSSLKTIEIGDGRYDILEFIDRQIALGRKPADISREVAHFWAMKTDAEYRRKFLGNKSRPQLSQDHIDAAYEAMNEQRVRLSLSDDSVKSKVVRVGEDGETTEVDIPDRPKSEHGADGVVDPDSYFKHIYRPDRLADIGEEQEFIRLESRAWAENWRDDLTGQTFYDAPPNVQRMLVERGIDHAKGVYVAITQKHNTAGQGHTGNIRNQGNRRGSVLERNVFIPTKELLRRGWIEDDVQLVMAQALRQNGTDAVLARRFRRPMTDEELVLAKRNSKDAYWMDGEDPSSIPDLDLAVPKKAVADDFEELLLDAKTDAERQRLVRLRDQTLDDVEQSINLMRGTHQGVNGLDQYGSVTDRTLAAVRDFNFSRMMGNIVLSSMPDAPMLALQHGMLPVIGTLSKRLRSRALELFKDVDAKSVHRLRHEARIAGAELELTSMQRAVSLSDVGDPFNGFDSHSTVFQRFARNAAFYGSRITGAAYWNASMKQLNHAIYTDRMIRLALKQPEFASKRDVRWAKALGAKNEFLSALRKQLDADGTVEEGGLFMPRTEDWPLELREQFYAMSQLSSRRSVLTPGILEKPQITHNQFGSTVLQFAGHAFASTHRVLGASAQRLAADGALSSEAASLYMVMASMMATAALSITLRYMAAGNLDKLPDVFDNPGWWIYETADRSGLLGLFGHINNIVESSNAPGHGTLPGIRSGLATALGDEGRHVGSTARSFPRNPIVAAGGPTFSTVGSAFNVASDLVSAPFVDRAIDQNTIKDMRRLTPFIDTFYTRQAARAVEGYIVEELLEEPYRK